jgi:segregation and condensation protein B
MDYLVRHVEALIFCSPHPIKIEEMATCLSEMFDVAVPTTDIQQAIDELVAKYHEEGFSMEITRSGGGYQFMTKPEYQASIGILLKQQSKKRLSTAALETLAIVAYKQPVSKPQVEQIRGVNCDYAVKKLLEKELIEIKGKSDGIGKPLLYGTSGKFLEYFGINSVDQLPTLKDFAEEPNEIGAPEDEIIEAGNDAATDN